MNQNKFIALCLISASVLALSGCSLIGGSSEYGCKGMPNSVTCMSVREVHDLTDGDDYQERIQAASEQQLNGKPVEVRQQVVGANNNGVTVSAGAQYVPVPAATANPQPIRTPSIVMRVLVDPYESSDGDLNVPGYVYTEIEQRRWEVGVTRNATTIPVIRPMSAPQTSNVEPAATPKSGR